MGIETAIALGIGGAVGGFLGGREQAGAAKDIAGTQTLAQLEALQMQTDALERAAEVEAKALTDAAQIRSDAELEIARMEEGGLDRDWQYQINFLNNYRQDLAQAVQGGRMDVNQAFDQARTDLQAGGADMEAAYIGGVEGLEPYTTAGINALERAEQIFQAGPGELAPWEQREFGRGIEALQAASSKVSGGGVSSRMLENAMRFGQEFATSRRERYLNKLVPFLELGETAALGQASLEAQRGNVLATLGTTQAGLAAERGGTLADLRLAGVAGSFDPEQPVSAYAASHEGVAQMYRDILGREAAPTAHAAWTAEIAAGRMTPAQVAEAIRISPEAQSYTGSNLLTAAPKKNIVGMNFLGYTNVPGMGRMPKYG